MLELKSPKHFQAIGMLARSIFELAVDISIFNQAQGCRNQDAGISRR
jgi:hypothetical protein